jgi:hypothetical protein
MLQRGEGIAPRHAAHNDTMGLPRDLLGDTGELWG